MLAWAAPLALLYGGSLIVAILHDRRKALAAPAELPDDELSARRLHHHAHVLHRAGVGTQP